MVPGDVAYLTQWLDLRVVDTRGTSVGRLLDLVAHWSDTEETPPRIVAAVVGDGRERRTVPVGQVSLHRDRVTLDADSTDWDATPTDLHLRRDVLDQQIVDKHDLRVVRVSDVRLAAVAGDALVVVGVDPGYAAVLRSLAPHGWGDRIARVFRLKDTGCIAWSDVEPTTLSDNGAIRLRTSLHGFRRLHPADIAEILEQLNPSDRNALLESLPVETAADAVTEADEEVQREIMEQLDPWMAADILEEMEPDDAADIVQDLSGSKRKELLDEMEAEEAEEVKELLHYDENTAGGLMTPEFYALPVHVTAQQAIDMLRETAPEAETVYYLYVVDDDGRLAGVISLRDLIVAQPSTPVWNFMVEGESVVRVMVDDALEDVAAQLEHYDLLAVPVVDREDRLIGIVTVDDTLEELLPDSWRRRRGRRHSAARADRADRVE
ncbi:MAG: magnesium transporter [Armatimonadota bacterium]